MTDMAIESHLADYENEDYDEDLLSKNLQNVYHGTYRDLDTILKKGLKKNSWVTRSQPEAWVYANPSYLPEGADTSHTGVVKLQVKDDWLDCAEKANPYSEGQVYKVNRHISPMAIIRYERETSIDNALRAKRV